MKRKLFQLFCLLALLGGLTFLLIPEQYQERIIRKLQQPYRTYYARSLKAKLDTQREQMQTFYNNSTKYDQNALIAHTCGVNEFSYKSSIEAVQDSLNKGFRFIEADLYKTTDGHLIATHSWEELARFMGLEVEKVKKMPLHELRKHKICGKYTVLSDEDICRFMRENPDMILVTDRIQDMKLLKEKIYFPDRTIIEVAEPYTYLRALELGFKYPALTTEHITTINYVEKTGIPLVVMHVHMLLSPETRDAVIRLHQNKVTVMIYHADECDKEEFIHANLGKHCSMIYSNNWSPAAPPPAAL